MRRAGTGSATWMTDLTDRVALVTGATRGIGAATAIRLAQAGADVAVGCGRNRDRAEEVAAEIRNLGPRATVVAGDLADPDVPARIAVQAAARLGPVDVLVAYAGTGPRADLADVDVRDQRYGRIVFVSSVAAFTGGIFSPQYTASKAGLIGLTHAIARPLAADGITVNPGEVADVVVAIIGHEFMTAQTVSVDGGMYPR